MPPYVAALLLTPPPFLMRPPMRLATLVAAWPPLRCPRASMERRPGDRQAELPAQRAPGGQGQGFQPRNSAQGRHGRKVGERHEHGQEEDRVLGRA